jgi:hypothetical protein
MTDVAPTPLSKAARAESMSGSAPAVASVW